ncbi:ribose-5-phosphate isomerase RpiA [Paracoccus suum]|uniref:Ribose-5-phosphate isomerase A n=1 Tax=Paracoccus suum TaxID=2259340 RepID=A0A344PP84_9RHOB|nr:ribose-5-phosphate isomerase RpiA [Paracoccus suum]AXC51189.1 ribose-5-phosphate isomerase RpiA [Paracoccus suum]
MTDPAAADAAKRAAARAAVAMVQNGMRLGLGTGSTAVIMVRELAARAAAERLSLRCAATSVATADLATSLGLKVEPLDAIGHLDMTIDGADEIDPDLTLIKGGGGALLREKIVAAASERMVVIADGAKVVEQLGGFPLPVEVLAFGLASTQQHIDHLLARMDMADRPVMLRQRSGSPYRTDEGNLILDLELGAIPDPQALAAGLSAIPGVVEHGLFLCLADIALIGQPDGTVTLLEADITPEEDLA